MLTITKRKNIFSEFYLFIYAISIFIVHFTRDSQINGYTPGSQNNLGYSILLLVLGLAIISNYVLLIVGNHYKIFNFHVVMGFLLFILFAIRTFTNYQSIDPYYLFIYLFIINANLVSFKQFLKVNFWVRLFSALSIILCSFLGLFPNNNSVAMFRNGAARYSLGYVGPNTLALSIFGVVLSLLLYSSVKKIKLSYIFLSFIILIGVSEISQSREVEFSSIILIILYLLYKIHVTSRFKINNILMIIIAILSLVLTIYVVFILKQNLLFYKINKLFSYRPFMSKSAFQVYPVRLFGYKSAPLLKTFNLSNSMDNLYTNTLFNYGLLGLIIFEVMLFKSCFLIIKHNKQLMCIVLISLLLTYTAASCDELYFIFVCVFALENQYKHKSKKLSMKGTKNYNDEPY